MRLVLLVGFLANAVICDNTDTKKLHLKQVIILSRHNIRGMIEEPLKLSTKKWPPLPPFQHLTRKGFIQEGYMGEYFKEWFHTEEFLEEKCPTGDEVYVYANSANRTVATAEAFVKSAFKDCNVTVHHNYTTDGQRDPLFSPAIRNTTAEYKKNTVNAINKALKNKKLNRALAKLGEILDIKNSEICKDESICDLNDVSKTEAVYKVGSELSWKGPMYVGLNAMDFFIINYYEGVPLDDIAWGVIQTEQWELMSEILRMDNYMRYTTVADDVGVPLTDYIIQILLKNDKKRKLTFLSGHDYNINIVLNSLRVKPFHPLPDQYELYPIGSKLVFELWTDNKTDYLKIEYVYATWTQIREGVKLSLDNPPNRITLQLDWCEVDKNGFCPYEEFVKTLATF